MRKVVFALITFIFFANTYIWAGDLDTCFDYAGKTFNISPALLKSIAKVESNLNQRAVHTDKNGTVDVGIMQINSSWIKVIGWRHWARLKIDACYNIYVGAWILSKCIKRYGYTWDAVSCYHTGSPHSYSYTKKVYITYISQYWKN